MNNKIFIGVIIVLFVVVGGFFIFSQSDDNASESTSSESSETSGTVQEDMSIIPADLPAAVSKAIERQPEPNVYVIDVRTPEEWEAGHVVDAMLWGLDEEIALGNLPPVPKDSEIYIYCRTGNRAGQAIRILQASGYTNMTNIRGLTDWIDAGGAVETGA